MIVDVAHLNDPGFWDVLEVSKDPVVDSHACCRELCNKTRNLTDEMIKALAEQDGVIGISFVKGHLSEDAEKANVETVVDHVEHVVNIVGVNHVGIGSDFDGGGLALQDATKMPEITMELVRRGHSDNEVEKILGGNFLRIFKKVWKT
jgi:membrane dipeptidase